MTNSEKIKRQRESLPQAIHDSLVVMGVEATNFFVASFNNQSFTDTEQDMWEERKNNKDPGRLILVGPAKKGGGDLRRSIRVVETTLDSVTIGSDLPYARIQNEGGVNGTGGIIPKREFMGNSRTLMEIIKSKIDTRIKQIFGHIK
jgi:phage gpG-like protein